MKKKRYIEKMFGGVTIRNCYEDSRINTGRKEIFYGNF